MPVSAAARCTSARFTAANRAPASDETLCSFQHDAAISALSFRTDGYSWLLSGDAKGAVAAWDLDTRRIHCMNKSAHTMAVTTMCCLPNQPVLLTASPDNSMKMWVFDGLDGGAEALHAEPSAFLLGAGRAAACRPQRCGVDTWVQQSPTQTKTIPTEYAAIMRYRAGQFTS